MQDVKFMEESSVSVKPHFIYLLSSLVSLVCFAAPSCSTMVSWYIFGGHKVSENGAAAAFWKDITAS